VVVVVVVVVGDSSTTSAMGTVQREVVAVSSAGAR
jgi:hypothetical protein